MDEKIIMNIGGVELKMGIELPGINNEDYLEVVDKLQDSIIDVIEKSGYKCVICVSKPIDKSDL